MKKGLVNKERASGNPGGRYSKKSCNYSVKKKKALSSTAHNPTSNLPVSAGVKQVSSPLKTNETVEIQYMTYFALWPLS